MQHAIRITGPEGQVDDVVEHADQADWRTSDLGAFARKLRAAAQEHVPDSAEWSWSLLPSADDYYMTSVSVAGGWRVESSPFQLPNSIVEAMPAEWTGDPNWKAGRA